MEITFRVFYPAHLDDATIVRVIESALHAGLDPIPALVQKTIDDAWGSAGVRAERTFHYQHAGGPVRAGAFTGLRQQSHITPVVLRHVASRYVRARSAGPRRYT